MTIHLEIEVNSSGQQEDDYENARKLGKDLIDLVDLDKTAKLLTYRIVR